MQLFISRRLSCLMNGKGKRKGNGGDATHSAEQFVDVFMGRCS